MTEDILQAIKKKAEERFSEEISDNYEDKRSAYTSGCIEWIEKVFEAIDNMKARYPTSVFPEDGESQDCKSALMARAVCDNLKNDIIKQLNNG